MALAALATAAVPGLDVVATREPQRLAGDVQSTGVLDSSGRRWVVRCPTDAAAGAALEAENALVENLALAVKDGLLPFAVPRAEGVVPLPEGGRAFVHRQLRGRPLDLSALTPGPGLAADLARAIAALHELPVRYVEDAGLPSYEAGEIRQRALATVDEAARTSRVPTSLLLRWEQALEDVALWRFRPVPVHGDLAEEHVLVLDHEVSAILGFASAHVGDPASDLAWLMAEAPPECLDTVVEAYALARPEHATGQLTERALLHSELALAHWLLHGVHRGDDRVISDAGAMLADLAEQVADADPIGAQPPVLVAGRSADWQDAEGFGEAPDTNADHTGTRDTDAYDTDADDAGTHHAGVRGGSPAGGDVSRQAHDTQPVPRIDAASAEELGLRELRPRRIDDEHAAEDGEDRAGEDPR